MEGHAQSPGGGAWGVEREGRRWPPLWRCCRHILACGQGMRTRFGRLWVCGGGLGRMGMAKEESGAANEQKALGSEIGLGRWLCFKPYRMVLRSVRTPSTILGLLLNFHQAKSLLKRSEGSGE